MNVFDASALLAYLRGETGSEVVRERLAEGGCCGAANWVEVAQKITAAGGDWGLARGLLQSYDLKVEPVTEADQNVLRHCGALATASRWRTSSASPSPNG